MGKRVRKQAMSEEKKAVIEESFDNRNDEIKIGLVNIILILTALVASMSGIIFSINSGLIAVIIICWIVAAFICLLGSILLPKLSSRRLNILRAGNEQLSVFGISCSLTFILYVLGIFGHLSGVPSFMDDKKLWLINLIFSIVAEGMVFWSGMLRIFFTSEQLAVKWRAIAIGCGLIPVANVIVLRKMMAIVREEIQFENNRMVVNINRKGQKICETKYPIFMVHGIFFRDFAYLNYWGRIPKALEENGATIFYGNHQSAASVEKCAEELAARLKEICEKTGCGKVNVIAHSKGGLDMRYAISHLGASQYVASLTTINTPHRGCEFADYLLGKIPKEQQLLVAKQYNAAFTKLGDKEPDFLEGVSDLTDTACEKFNADTPDMPGIYYQSVGSKQNHALSGRFPLNMSYLFVKHFDGPNDGLVGEKSFKWGEDYTFLTTTGKRGISHGDMIDLNRENIKDFDVREFYIQLVHRLKERGL